MKQERSGIGRDQVTIVRSCNGISHHTDRFDGGPKYKKIATHSQGDGQSCPCGQRYCAEKGKETDENNNHPKDRSWIVKKLQYQRSVRRLPWWLKWLKEREHIVDDNLEVAKLQKDLFGRIHRHADSLFSTSSGFADFRGFFNLAVLLLLLSSARVALENVIKYGILVDPILLLQLFFIDPYSLPSFSLVLCCNLYILFAYCVESLLSKGSISEGLGCVLHITNLALELGCPCFVILWKHPSPVFSSIALMVCVVVFLKLVSYKQTLKWCRAQQVTIKKEQTYRRHRQKSISVHTKKTQDTMIANGSVGHSTAKVVYPDNLSLADLYYFLSVPTLCYEMSFPLSTRIRKRFLIKRIAEVVFISGLVTALIQQWVLPLVNNALVPFSEMQLPKMLERILKLALPNFFIWLLWFYVTFHSMFNVCAELLRFGDRVFYQDWWNAESVTEFWQKWNVPVHRWAVRHLYKPMLSYGYNSTQAAMAVFAVSAFFHEFLVSVPLGIFRLYAFMGMIVQVPLAMLTSKLNKTSPKLCNVIVWCSLILGQPVALLMYYVDYYVESQRSSGQ